MTTKINDHVSFQVTHDDNAEAPDWDTLGRIVYSQRARNLLGNDAVSRDEMDDIKRKIETGEYIGLPVWAYIHGRAVIQAAETNPYTCPWDSGQSGFVYTTHEKVLAEYGGKRVSPQKRAKALDALKSEVRVFSQYIEGDVWCADVLVDGEVVESLCDIYGHDYAVDEARRMAEARVCRMAETPNKETADAEVREPETT